MNRKRVLRIWRQQGLKVPIRKVKKSRLWLENGRSVRLKPERRNHVWCYDFAYERTEDGRPVRILTVVDEYTREALAAKARRSFPSRDVIEVLQDLMLTHGPPDNIRSYTFLKSFIRPGDMGMRDACSGADKVRSTGRERPFRSSASECLCRTCAPTGPAAIAKPCGEFALLSSLYRNRPASPQTCTRTTPIAHQAMRRSSQ